MSIDEVNVSSVELQMPMKQSAEEKAKAKATKAKAKAKLAKAKAKAKAKLAKAKRAKSTAADQDPETNEFQIIVATKPKLPNLNAFRRQLVKKLGSKPLDEAVEEQAQKRQRLSETAAQVEATKLDLQVEYAKTEAEFQVARAKVAEAMAKEIEAAEAFKFARLESEKGEKIVKDAEAKLALAHKKLAMAEVLATNKRRMKEFEDAKKSSD